MNFLNKKKKNVTDPFIVSQVPNSSLHPSVCNVSSCQGLDRSSANKYGGSRNRMHSDYEYESASLLYGHVNQQQPQQQPPCNKRSPDEQHQQQQFNTCCSEGNGIDRCVQSTLPGLAYKHHSGKRCHRLVICNTA